MRNLFFIFNRIVHFLECYWSAYNHCQAVGGILLQLDNVVKVMTDIGKAMKGNDAEFRIVGHAGGKW